MSVLSVFIFMLMCVSGNITVTDYTDFQLFPFSEYPVHVQPSGSINYKKISSFGQKFTFSPLNDLCNPTDRLYARHYNDIIPIQLLELVLPFIP